MSDIKEFGMFALKVALTILIINQVPAISGIVNKNYFSS